MLIILARTGLPPAGTRGAFFGNLSYMLPMGLTNWKPLNGVDPEQVNGFVAWTLGYEWQFYLALPLLAIFARPSRRFIVIMIGFAAFYAYRMLNRTVRSWSAAAHHFIFHFYCGTVDREVARGNGTDPAPGRAVGKPRVHRLHRSFAGLLLQRLHAGHISIGRGCVSSSSSRQFRFWAADVPAPKCWGPPATAFT